MKIIVSMDERGWIVARNVQGDILEECFFKTDDETDEEIRAWGYQQQNLENLRYNHYAPIRCGITVCHV